ncbi:MAG: L-serine ammonia-lyase, iron-sulfur-dependent subunit beta [Treponema sp.]|nr:L-serine ammonia-lyase, iron-sulfur-dependent subunit beta [Treponema sp.]
MNIFNIIGPVMIGPSSSHTAGAVRLGRVVNKILNGVPPKTVRIQLSGSFARTYRGHGTDRALLAGIMGYHSYSEEIRDAREIALQRGIDYAFEEKDIPNAHPNTAKICVVAVDGKETVVEGASIGGGNILISHINNMTVDFTGENNTILVVHYDRPGLVAAVTHVIAEKYRNVNIGNFRLSRPVKGGEAIMMIELDDSAPTEMIDDLKRLDNVVNVMLIRAI